MLKMLNVLLVTAFLSGFSGLSFADEVLHNSDVVSMLGASLNKTLIIQKIVQSESNFDVTSDALVELRKKEVPDDVIKIMLDVTNKHRHKRQVQIGLQIQNLTSPREETRQMAYLQLLRMGGPARISMIETLTETRSDDMRAALATAFGRMGMADSIQMIAVLLEDPVHKVRVAAADSIFKLDEDRAREVVARSMRTWWVDRPKHPRECYLRLSGLLLREQDSETMKRVLVESPDWEEREQAAWYFTRVKIFESRLALEQTLEIDSSLPVRTMAASALGYIADPRSAKVMKRAFVVDADNRVAVVGALEKLPADNSIPALISFFSVRDITEKEEILVGQTLQRLTRQNFGIDQPRWLKWWEQHERRRAIREFGKVN